MVKVIEKATGTQYQAKAIEGGFEVYTLEGERYKKLKESTFKRYFKTLANAEAETEAKDEEVEQPKEETPKQTKKSKSSGKKQKTEPTPEPEVEKTEAEPEETKNKAKATEEPKVELDDVSRANIVEKIKKMLNLSRNNSSQEEAASAVLMAQKLMMKYGIHEEDVTLEEVKDEIKSMVATLKKNSDFHSWRKPLGVIVAKNFRVKTYMNGDKDIVFRGYKEDVKIAVEVFHYLYAVGNRFGCKIYHDILAATGSGKGVYHDFILGFLEGIEKAFDEQCTALMVVTPKEVEEEFAQFSEGFKHTKTQVKGHRNQLYEAGVIEGKNAVKSRQLTDKTNK